MRLPVLSAIGESPVSGSSTNDAATPRRILIVDDNIDAAATLEMLLGMRGHATRVAHNGLAAVEIVRSFDADLVLLDIGLPDIDGYEVARRIRPLRPTMRIVALTGWGAEEDKKLSKAAGFDDHLTKPVAIENLNVQLLIPIDSAAVFTNGAQGWRET